MSYSVAPGSPVFSPSRLPAALVSFKAAPEQNSSSVFPASPLRLFALRARRRPEPSPCKQAPALNSSSALKRRRPAPLVVPAVVAAPAEALQADHGMSEVAEEGEGFAAYCRRGNGRKRVEMEDRHIATVGLGGDPHAKLFGVFDGHGGKSAAEFAADNMPRIMSEELEKAKGGWTTVEDAVRRAYLRTDEDFLREKDCAGGACSVTALLHEGRLVVSSAGDCRAVLSRAGKAEALTDDHRASRADERDRIESLGGLVMNCRGTWRVQGSLAVSRGIGDAHLKPWVVAEPETRTIAVDAECELLILASDGLWDKVGNQEAVDVAQIGAASSSLSAACSRLVEMAVNRGSTDDISVVFIQLRR